MFFSDVEHCTYQFVLDGNGNVMGGAAILSNLTVLIAGLDKDGNSIAPLQLRTKRIGGDNAHRYVQVSAEGPCGAEKFMITGATAMIAGKNTDLLKADAFQQLPTAPLSVTIAKGSSGAKP